MDWITFLGKERQQIKKRDTRHLCTEVINSVSVNDDGLNPTKQSNRNGRLLSSSAFPIGIYSQPPCDQAIGLVIDVMNEFSSLCNINDH